MSSPEEIEPIFVDQTKKYVDVVGERDYITTSDLHDHPFFRKFISEETYKEALSGVAIQCVDMLIYNEANDSFLIGTRQQEPHAGDWVIGGRMRAGESEVEAAARNMKRELGLEIDRTKLRKVAHYNMVWDSREQPGLGVMDDEQNPTKIVGYAKGCHMTSELELYPLSSEELEQLQHNEEYSVLRWLTPDEVINAPSGAFHPTLVDMFKDGLDTVTTPDTPKDLADEHLRLIGAAATARSALRNFETENRQ